MSSDASGEPYKKQKTKISAQGGRRRRPGVRDTTFGPTLALIDQEIQRGVDHAKRSFVLKVKEVLPLPTREPSEWHGHQHLRELRDTCRRAEGVMIANNMSAALHDQQLPAEDAKLWREW